LSAAAARLPRVAKTGSTSTRLVILRGNSGSGKSSTAQELRARLGRGIAWVEQDHLRRIVLRERDVPGGVNIGLINQTARYALDSRYDVILEGILDAGRYGHMLQELTADHLGTTRHYYFDIPFEQTVRRHAARPMAKEVTPEQMREWYRERDLLPSIEQQIIKESSSLDDTVERILTELGLEARHG
jgi:shikimate kinase